MNYLAHQFLSGDNPGIRVGNFMADFIKGNKFQNFEKDIQTGILFHREIDWYTDNHKITVELREEFRAYFGKYSGVALDLYFDHFLAKNWEKYSNKDLGEYTHEVYEIMDQHSELFPNRLKNMLFYMKRDNWLLGYQYLEGIGRALTGLSKRTSFESGLEKGQSVLEENYQLIEKGFIEFISDIISEKEFLLKKVI